jgi:hypothetical protein
VARAAAVAAVCAAAFAVAGISRGADQIRVLFLTVAPNLTWCVFFLAWRRRPERVRAASVAVLLFAIPAQVISLIAAVSSALDLAGAGGLLAAMACLATAGWALLLVTLAANLAWPPRETLASALGIAVAAAGIDDVLVASSRLLSLAATPVVFWRNDPAGTLWRLALEPGLRLAWVAAQVFFLRALGAQTAGRPGWSSL